MKKLLILPFLLLLLNLSIQAQTAKPAKVIPIAEHYTGGQDSMYAFINRNVVYPMTAKRNRIQGECIINIVLEADGSTSGFNIVKNIGGGCGDEALRVVKTLKFNAPGYRLQTSVPVIFKIK